MSFSDSIMPHKKADEQRLSACKTGGHLVQAIKTKVMMDAGYRRFLKAPHVHDVFEMLDITKQATDAARDDSHYESIVYPIRMTHQREAMAEAGHLTEEHVSVVGFAGLADELDYDMIRANYYNQELVKRAPLLRKAVERAKDPVFEQVQKLIQDDRARLARSGKVTSMKSVVKFIEAHRIQSCLNDYDDDPTLLALYLNPNTEELFARVKVERSCKATVPTGYGTPYELRDFGRWGRVILENILREVPDKAVRAKHFKRWLVDFRDLYSYQTNSGSETCRTLQSGITHEVYLPPALSFNRSMVDHGVDRVYNQIKDILQYKAAQEYWKKGEFILCLMVGYMRKGGHDDLYRILCDTMAATDKKIGHNTNMWRLETATFLELAMVESIKDIKPCMLRVMIGPCGTKRPIAPLWAHACINNDSTSLNLHYIHQPALRALERKLWARHGLWSIARRFVVERTYGWRFISNHEEIAHHSYTDPATGASLPFGREAIEATLAMSAQESGLNMETLPDVVRQPIFVNYTNGRALASGDLKLQVYTARLRKRVIQDLEVAGAMGIFARDGPDTDEDEPDDTDPGQEFHHGTPAKRLKSLRDTLRHNDRTRSGGFTEFNLIARNSDLAKELGTKTESDALQKEGLLSHEQAVAQAELAAFKGRAEDRDQARAQMRQEGEWKERLRA